MTYYVFKNRRNGKYISGTNFNYDKYKQILADSYRPPKLMASDLEVEYEMIHRRINPATYKVVEVELREVEQDKAMKII